MFDYNFEFGDFSLTTSGGSVQGYIKDMSNEAHIEKGTPYRVVVIPAANATGSLTVEFLEADAVTESSGDYSMTSAVATHTFVITNPEKGKKYSFDFPTVHKRYVSLRMTGSMTLDVYAGVERLGW